MKFSLKVRCVNWELQEVWPVNVEQASRFICLPFLRTTFPLTKSLWRDLKK